MDNERLPIKFFAPREIDELRVEGNRNQEPPRWLLTGQDLIDRSTHGSPGKCSSCRWWPGRYTGRPAGIS